jgi:hypothetical protein
LKTILIILFFPFVIHANNLNSYFKIAAKSSTKCIVPGPGNRFSVKPCAEASPNWSYKDQTLQYTENRCLTIEEVVGGYRVTGNICDKRPEQVISHIGKKFIHKGLNVCLTTENNIIGVRGVSSCYFKSPWQDFDTPSNLFLVPTTDDVVYDFKHSRVFQAVDRPFIDPLVINTHQFYKNIDKWFKQTQYQDAYDYAEGHIFKGHSNVSVFQTDNSVPSKQRYPDIIGAADIPPGGHADHVAGILYDCESSNKNYLFYMGCLTDVTKTAFPTQRVNDALRDSAHDWRAIEDWVGDVFPNGIIPSIYNASVANAFFVISDSPTISSQDLSVRMGDYILDKFNILGIVAQPGSYTTVNNTVSGNLYNALVVGNLDAGLNYGTESTLDNTNNHSRSKPDIVTLAQNRASSSSWATPTVSVLAAGLLSVAKTDKRFALAEKIEVIAAIILAGAAKDSEVPTQLRIWNPSTGSLEPWEWSQSLPDEPFDKYFGVGILNHLKVYQIFFNGLYKKIPRGNGWDTQFIHAGEVKKYLLDDSKKNNFSSVLYWNRRIVATKARMLIGHLANLQLELQKEDGTSIAISNAKGNNRQHIFLKELPQGSLQLIVRNMGASDIRYGLAWRTDELLDSQH